MPDPGVSSTPPIDTPRPSLDQLSPPQLTEWRKTGEWPTAAPSDEPTADVPADAEPEPSAAPAAEPVAAAPTPIAEPWTDPETGVPIEKPTRGDKRIKRLWQEREDARKALAALQTELALARRAPTGAEIKAADQATDRIHAVPVSPDDPEPQEDAIGTTYADYSAYIRALAKWEGRQEARAMVRAESAARDQRARHETVARGYGERVEAFKATPEGKEFDAVVAAAGDLPVSEPMADVIRHEPLGPALQHYLCTHPRDCERIAALPPGPALVELGRLLATIAAPATPTADTVSRITQLPAPPHTLGSRSAAPTDPIARAVTQRDQAAYTREMNARDLASRR